MSAYGTIRQTFTETMLEYGLKDPRLTVLVSDITHFKLQPFANNCPGRYYNIGVCEQTIMSMASGLSMVGLIPVIHTITPFFIERAYEQIKLDFGYQKQAVNIITVGSAFDYSQLGTTHHSYGDFALMKTIENMQILYPASEIEFRELFRQTYDNKFPTYTRIPGMTHGVLFKPSQIKFGKGILVRPGKDITIIAVGTQLKTVMDSMNDLFMAKIDPEIIYINTIKPLDEQLIEKSVKKTGKFICIEEHGKYGGLYDDILRLLSSKIQIRSASINIGDKFIHHYGTYTDLLEYLNFSPSYLVKVIKYIIK